MHIAIDALFRLHAGAGLTHLQAIISGWREAIPRTGDRLTIITTPAGMAALGHLRGEGVTFHVFAWPGQRVLRRVIWEQIRLPQVISELAPDVLFCPGNMAPLRVHTPVVLVLQAPFCPDAPLSNRRRLAGHLMRLSARRASQVIGISPMMADLAIRNFGVDPGRVSVIPYGHDVTSSSYQPSESGTAPYPFPYLLCISAIRRYKCMAELITGFSQMYRDPTNADSDLHLIIAGLADDPVYAAELYAQVTELGLTDRVIFTGAVPRSAIDRLLGGALALVYNSTCESFGLPLLEAMTANVPVACSRVPAMLEVAGDAALTFEARSSDQIAATLSQLRDPVIRADLIARGKIRLAHFNPWVQVAEQTRAVLLKAVTRS
jgi:glycosyltransferase involved in cell wall biosynthesis